MTDKEAITGFIATAALLVLLFAMTLLLDGDNRSIFLEEGGVVELASAIGYFLCAVFILYKGRSAYLVRHNYFLLLIIFFMLRELDFDKRFTTMGIFKSKFLVSSSVPLIEKLVGIVVILILLYVIFSILYFHFKSFYSGLASRSTVSLGALITLVFLVVSKSLDGIARKLHDFGIEVPERTAMHASAIEEILELGIPIILFFTFSVYFRQVKAQQ